MPKDEIPPIVDELPVITPPKIKTSFVDLIKPEDKYQITENPYLTESYKKLSRILALTGDFEVAKLHIKGSFQDNKDYFLSINIGEESGIYNAVRKSSDGLDITLTKENGGVFNKDNPINLEIDLLGKSTLSTTKEEFLSSRNTTKLVRFWDFIQPQPPAPSVNRILVTPFNKDGFYTGTIESLSFEYQCKIGSKCSAVRCDNDKFATECLLQNFGTEAKESWEKWYRETTN